MYDDSYYSLRCVSYTYIVESKKDLPHCDSLANASFENFYVTSERSNYYCTGTHWVDDFTDDCPSSSKGIRVSFGDTLFICKNGYWQLADLDDAREKCNSESEGKIMLFNGNRYACEDDRWRIFNDMEDSIGYCNTKKQGTLDTLYAGLKMNIYACDTSGWRSAKLSDYLGECNSKNVDKTTEHDSIGYVCAMDSYNKSYNWKKLSALEKDIGICNSKRVGEFDTTKADTLPKPYYCDSTGWRTPTIKDYGGECSELKEGKELHFLEYHYICRDNYWEKLSGLEQHLGICNKKKQGKTEVSSYDKHTYLCDSLTWVKQLASDVAGECNKKIMDKTIVYAGDTLYCSGEVWIKEKELPATAERASSMYTGFTAYPKKATHCLLSNEGALDSTYHAAGRDTIFHYFICNPHTDYYSGWESTTKAKGHLGNCDSTNLHKVKTTGDSTYACRSIVNNGNWELVPAIAQKYGDCYLQNTNYVEYGTTGVYKDTSYMCRDGGWKTKDERDKAFGFCKTASDATIRKLGNFAYHCKNWEWTKLEFPETVLGLCVTAIYDSIREADDVGFICKAGEWKRQSASEYLPKCTGDLLGTERTYDREDYLCRSSAWRTKNSTEKDLGFCTKEKVGTFKKLGKYDYRCSGYFNWEVASDIEVKLGVCKLDTAFTKQVDDVWYACSNGSWVKTTSVNDVFGDCKTGFTKARQEIFNGKAYVCDTTTGYSTWKQVTTIDSIAGLCNTANLDKKTATNVGFYKCELNKTTNQKQWNKLTISDYFGNCYTKEGEEIYNGLDTVVCKNGSWEIKSISLFTDSRDNKTYPYATFNKVTWMTEPLAYENASKDSIWHDYENLDHKVDLYSYTLAQEVCPNGWKLPSKKDYENLFNTFTSIDSSLADPIKASTYLGFHFWAAQYVTYFVYNDNSTIEVRGNGMIPVMWTSDIGKDSYFSTDEKLAKSLPGGTNYSDTSKIIGLGVHCIKK